MKARTSGAGARVIQWLSGTLRLRPGQATNSCPSRFFSKAGRTGVSDHSTSLRAGSTQAGVGPDGDGGAGKTQGPSTSLGMTELGWVQANAQGQRWTGVSDPSTSSGQAPHENWSWLKMEKRKPEIIRDNKKRGEWAESVFVARAVEHGLEISKPFGESGRFDCVVGGPGKFVAVQVKCTIAKQPNAKGYICNLKSNNKKYRPGSFDFVAAYAILEDTWYIVPEKTIRGIGAITLCSTMPKYEQYRESWHLSRESWRQAGKERMREREGQTIGAGMAR